MGEVSFEDMLSLPDDEVDKLLSHYEEYKKDRGDFHKNAFIELPPFPPLVVDCVRFLRYNGGLKSEGIFRVNGDSHAVDAIKSSYLKPLDLNDILLNVEQDLKLRNYDVATALKSYFRLLKHPLVPYDTYEKMKEAVKADEKTAIVAMRREIGSMQQPNLHVFAYTMIFFQDICAQNEVNKMSPNNLATCLTMSITRFREAEGEGAYFAAMVEVGISTKIISFLLAAVDFTEFIDPESYFAFLKNTKYRNANIPKTIEEFMETVEYEKFKARYHEEMRRKQGPPPVPRRGKKKNRFFF